MSPAPMCFDVVRRAAGWLSLGTSISVPWSMPGTLGTAPDGSRYLRLPAVSPLIR
jgi:hypothetical protein